MSAKVISTDLFPYIKESLSVRDLFIASGSGLLDSVSPNKSFALSDHLNQSSLRPRGRTSFWFY